MEPQDILLSYRVNGSTETREYSAYRIDYDDSQSLREILGLDSTGSLSDQYSGDVKAVGQTAVDRGYHTVKDGYQHKLLVSDTTTKDEVQTDLDGASITYTTEDVSPTVYEKKAIKALGATTDTHMPSVMSWYSDLQTLWEEAVDDYQNGNLSESNLIRGYNAYRDKTIPMPNNIERM